MLEQDWFQNQLGFSAQQHGDTVPLRGWVRAKRGKLLNPSLNGFGAPEVIEEKKVVLKEMTEDEQKAYLLAQEEAAGKQAAQAERNRRLAEQKAKEKALDRARAEALARETGTATTSTTTPSSDPVAPVVPPKKSSLGSVLGGLALAWWAFR